MSVIAITKENFEAEITKSGQPVLLDFWAPWCVPCRKVGAIVEELATEQTEVKMAKLNIEDEPQLAASLGIMSIPALIFFKNGKVVKKVAGLQPKKAIIKMISK